MSKQGYHLPPNDWPQYLRSFDCLMGIYVGGCFVGNNIETDTLAHAHPHSGWICLPCKTRLRTRNLMLHEVAHLMSEHPRHNKGWRNNLRKIGGTTKQVPISGSVWDMRSYSKGKR